MNENTTGLPESFQSSAGDERPEASQRTVRVKKRAERQQEIARQIAFHEASHAVIHFATETPHSPCLVLDEMASYYHCRRFGDDVAAAWMALAGPIGGAVYQLGQFAPGDEFSPSLLGLRVRVGGSDDHHFAARKLLPWFRQGMSPRRGRVGARLRQECTHVSSLLEANWPIVKRVAEAALSAGRLEETDMNRLIQEPGDLVEVWNSPVAEAFRTSGRRWKQEWRAEAKQRQE